MNRIWNEDHIFRFMRLCKKDIEYYKLVELFVEELDANEVDVFLAHFPDMLRKTATELEKVIEQTKDWKVEENWDEKSC